MGTQNMDLTFYLVGKATSMPWEAEGSYRGSRNCLRRPSMVETSWRVVSAEVSAASSIKCSYPSLLGRHEDLMSLTVSNEALNAVPGIQ